MRKPARAWPAASASARLATSRLLPTFGSPPTNKMPCGGNSPGSIHPGGGAAGCSVSSCAHANAGGFEVLRQIGVEFLAPESLQVILHANALPQGFMHLQRKRTPQQRLAD